jgi:hypothetical protein
MRAEFAVLTGVPESALGYDRFNPYYALARVPIESQVWRLRRAGYRTICLHPFDRRFFRRDLAMPALGFEQFLAARRSAAGAKPPIARTRVGRRYPANPRRVRSARPISRSRWAITAPGWRRDRQSIPPCPASSTRRSAGRRRPVALSRQLRRSDEMLRVLMSGLRGKPRRCSPFTAIICRAFPTPSAISALSNHRATMRSGPTGAGPMGAGPA